MRVKILAIGLIGVLGLLVPGGVGRWGQARVDPSDARPRNMYVLERAATDLTFQMAGANGWKNPEAFDAHVAAPP